MTRTDEIRARLAAATGGDWTADGASVYGPLDTRSRYRNGRQLVATVTDKPLAPGVSPGPHHADATLIAHARADLAYLLDEVAQLRKDAARWEATAQAINLRLHREAQLVGFMSGAIEEALREISDGRVKNLAKAKRSLKRALVELKRSAES